MHEYDYYYDPNRFYIPNANAQNADAYYQMQMQEYYKEQRRKNEKKELVKVGFAVGGTLIFYLILQSIASVFLLNDSVSNLYDKSPTFQNCFNIVAVHIFAMLLSFGLMALIMKKHYNGELIPVQKVGFLNGLSWCGVGLLGALLANFGTSYIITFVEACGYKLTQNEMLDPDSPIACVALLMSTAIIPGIVEEFALRCCTLGILKNYGKGFGIFAVSVVFGLMHGNVIQFIYAFFVGLILGYITIKTGNVVIAMFVHGLSNFVSVVNDIVTYATSDEIATIVVICMYIAYAALGAFGIVYLIRKKDFTIKKDNSEPKSSLSFGAKLLCLIPGLIIPFVILIFTTTQYITKV